MLKQQLRATGVLADNLLTLINAMPREIFVPKALANLAYADANLPLGHDQIMLRPNEDAHIVQALAIQRYETILEIGTGSGYLTALLAKLSKFVYSIDIFLDFTEQAQQHLAAVKIDNVQLITDDANKCWDHYGTYDVICCTASLPLYPEVFKHRLNVGGRLFVIVGSAPAMQATLITRTAETIWSETILFETVVPAMINTPTPEHFNF